MAEHKIAGCCTVCDARCFDVLQVNAENERNPGEPKRLGAPTEDAMRLTFMLYDGAHSDMTFCGACARTLDAGNYASIWAKVIRSWLQELGDSRPDWFMQQLANGLLVELDRTPWRKLNHG